VDLLLIGENAAFLRTLRAALARRGVASRDVHTRDALIRALGESTPDAALFDLVRALDALALNPRAQGFAGPLLLLADDPNLALAGRFLPAVHVLRKPFKLADLYEEVARLGA
jgi:DNA-binding response OmpR family regulator